MQRKLRLLQMFARLRLRLTGELHLLFFFEAKNRKLIIQLHYWNVVMSSVRPLIDILNYIFSYLELPPDVFGLNKYWRQAAINYYKCRPLTLAWIDRPRGVSISLAIYSADDLSKLLVRWEHKYMRYIYWYSGDDYPFYGDFKKIPIHVDALRLIAAAPPPAQMAVYRDLITNCSNYETAARIEGATDVVAVKNVPAGRQMEAIMNDNVYAIARMRKTRGTFADDILLGAAVEYGSWRIARHILSTPNSLNYISHLEYVREYEPTRRVNQWIALIKRRDDCCFRRDDGSFETYGERQRRLKNS